MKKLAVSLFLLLAINLNGVSQARADQAGEVAALKDEVVSALVEVFDGKLSNSDFRLYDLKQRAQNLPAGQLEDEIRAALAAVMP